MEIEVLGNESNNLLRGQIYKNIGLHFLYGSEFIAKCCTLNHKASIYKKK